MAKVQAKHIDKSVLYLFAGLSILSILIMAYKKATYVSCDEVAYTILNLNNKSSDFRVGEVIQFADFSQDATLWNWDFGDSTENSNIQVAHHAYEEPGKYIVKLKVNDHCLVQETVNVRELKFVVDSSKYPIFTLPKSIYVGQTLRARDKTANATSWEWRFGEDLLVNSTEKEPRHAYATPGRKTVKLVVNGNKKYVSSREIMVYERRPNEDPGDEIVEAVDDLGDYIPLAPPVEPDDQDPAEPAIEYNDIREKEFTRLIFELSNKKMTLQQFVSANMCTDKNVSIIANKKTMSLEDLYEKIAGQKIKLKGLTLVKDKTTGCIKTFNVNYSLRFQLF